MKLCKLKYCKLPYYKNKYCKNHYENFIGTGNPLKTRGKYKNCTIKNCNNKHEAKGLCINHYIKKYSKEHPEVGLKGWIKYLKKLGKYFDMTSGEYNSALICWSRSIKKLDNYMCKNCSSKKNLNAHHIMPKIDFPELSLNLDNGITLCEDCHSEMHGFDIYS